MSATHEALAGEPLRETSPRPIALPSSLSAAPPADAAARSDAPMRLEDGAAGVEAVAETVLEWSFNPWRQNLRNAMVGAIATAMITALIAGLGLPPLAVAALALVFLASVHSAILPTHCRVDNEGVARRLAFGWERRPWGLIRRASLGRKGLFVSPRFHPGPLDSFRGLWLPVPPPAGAALVDELRRRLAQHGLS